MNVTVHSIYDKQTGKNINYGFGDEAYMKCAFDMESTDKYDDRRYEYFGTDMEVQFKWDMTEEQFREYMQTFLTEHGKDDYCGSVFFGNFKFEFLTTPDGTYNNLFLYGHKGYGALEDGTPYDELPGFADKIHMHPRRTFDAFARDIESQIIECANEYTWCVEDMIPKTDPEKWFPNGHYYLFSKTTREN